MSESQFEPFKEQLHDLQETPPADGWTNIRSAMDANDHKYRVWYVVFGGLMGLLGWFWSGVNSPMQSQQTAHETPGQQHQTAEKVLQEACPPEPFIIQESPEAMYIQHAVADNDHKEAGTRTASIAKNDPVQHEFNLEKPAAAHDPTQSAQQANGFSTDIRPTSKAANLSHSSPLVDTLSKEHFAHSLHEPQLAPSDKGNDREPIATQVAEAGETYTDAAPIRKSNSGLRKWTIFPQMGLHYAFKNLRPTRDLTYFLGLENENEGSWKNVGYELSVHLRRNIGARTQLMIGTFWVMTKTYAHYRYFQIIADQVEVARVTSNSFDVETYHEIKSNEVLNTLQYAGISLGVAQKMRFLKRQHNLVAVFDLSRNIHQHLVGNEGGHAFRANRWMYSVRLGLENEVRIGHHLNLMVTPFLEQDINATYNSSSIYKLTLLKAGIHLGLPITNKQQRP